MQNLQNFINDARKRYKPKKVPYFTHPFPDVTFHSSKGLENQVFFEYDNQLWWFFFTQGLLTEINSFFKDSLNERASKDEWLCNPELSLVLVRFIHEFHSTLVKKADLEFLTHFLNYCNSFEDKSLSVALVKDGFKINGSIVDEGMKLNTKVFELSYQGIDVTAAFAAAGSMDIFEEQLSEVFPFVLALEDLDEYKSHLQKNEAEIECAA